jgi:hypothetical protein
VGITTSEAGQAWAWGGRARLSGDRWRQGPIGRGPMETKLGQVVAGDIGVEGLGLEAGRDAGRMEVVEGSGIDQGASDGEVARA